MVFSPGRGKQFLVTALCQVLVLQAAFAQQTTDQGQLKIAIVQGVDAKNVLQQIAPKPLIVRVDDAQNRPVGGAIVTFTTPSSGPSGQFENDDRIIRVTTDAEGVASVRAYHPNAVAGQYNITVRVESQGQAGVASIRQFNVEKKSHTKMFILLGVAGAVAGGVAASRKSGNSDTPAPATAPTITFGTPIVGAPGQ